MSSPTFRTEFPISSPDFRLKPGSRVVAMGSCFADTMGNHLKANKLRTSINPFGTIFQPLALFDLLMKAIVNGLPDERLFLQRDGRWFSYEAHSSVWGTTKEELLANFQQKLTQLHDDLQQADVLLLTLGSAWAYRLNEPPAYVANNHKQPATKFERDLLSVKDVCKAFGILNSQFSTFNSQLSIVLTVSPVRHARDGMPDNAVSKSVLRAACHYLTTDFPDVYYFPAYELLLDDLRDYRFYGPDLVHPNEVAEQYIFGKFAEACFSPELSTFVQEWAGVRRALAHRPFDETSTAHQVFLEKLKTQLETLANQMDVREEIAQIEARLKKS
ncbi:MAG: GSCFA domain-containing protein [Cytophagaceae bacterium]|nr:GSCFA domain-containing protein [Cytophagaceae bacterium]